MKDCMRWTVLWFKIWTESHEFWVQIQHSDRLTAGFEMLHPLSLWLLIGISCAANAFMSHSPMAGTGFRSTHIPERILQLKAEISKFWTDCKYSCATGEEQSVSMCVVTLTAAALGSGCQVSTYLHRTLLSEQHQPSGRHPSAQIHWQVKSGWFFFFQPMHMHTPPPKIHK